ncbi:MAG TPA: hypothetical protein VNA57_06870 [Acidimicrobiales bacterium]|nr:hypothetical protein [Acidimicrobiales bacterium]
MSRSVVERRLVEVNRRLKKAREELVVLDHQLAALAEEADDARLRALVSDSPLAQREHREAQKHADAMVRSRAAIVAAIAAHERTLDELLERLVVDSR